MPRIAGVQVALHAWHHNFRGDQLVIAVAVAKAESGWNTGSRYVSPYEDSRGLWQINTYAHPNFNGNSLYDAEYNAGAAWQVYSNSNHTWRPWTTYTRGTYQQFMGQASDAVAQLRSMGYNPGGVGTLQPADGGGNPDVAHQELHARWDYTPEIHLQAGHFTDMAADFLTGGNAIHSLAHWETFGHG